MAMDSWVAGDDRQRLEKVSVKQLEWLCFFVRKYTSKHVVGEKVP